MLTKFSDDRLKTAACIETQTDRQTNKQTNSQTNKQTNKPLNEHTCKFFTKILASNNFVGNNVF